MAGAARGWEGGFPKAPQAHILRALQKDQYYLSWLVQKVEAMAGNLCGHHAARAENEIRTAAYCAYFGLTTLLGKQTLGEEYCDIMQVCSLIIVLARLLSFGHTPRSFSSLPLPLTK